MTELGFGIVERRSVLAILFTFVVSYEWLGNAIPVETGGDSPLVSIFVSLVVLTGAIFLLRSSIRLILAIVGAILTIPRATFIAIFDARDTNTRFRIVFPLLYAWQSLIYLVVKHKNWGFRHNYYSPTPWQIGGDTSFGGRGNIDPIFGLVSIVDRFSLIVIAYWTTLPPAEILIRPLGLAGCGLMILIFVLSGRYTFLTWDASHEREMLEIDRHERLEYASRNPHFPDKIKTEPYVDNRFD